MMRKGDDEAPKVLPTSKSWLNLSQKLSNLSLSSSWAAGHQFISKSLAGASHHDHLELLRLSPDDIASQLTLLDLPVFQSIHPHELLSIESNSKNKSLAPSNVVALTRRFNQVSFWVVEEILFTSQYDLCNVSKEQKAKIRAEVITHFIKVARKLYEIKNLHSCYAIVSALNSSPLYRLSRTWPHVKTREKQMLSKLTHLFSDDSNFSTLREHMNHIEPPGIPYLGMYLRDLVYIKLAHPEGATRSHQTNQILNAISKFQSSSYAIETDSRIQSYLASAKYIEELQKFLEEDNYKQSLRLEPPSTLDRAPSHKQQERFLQQLTLRKATTAANTCGDFSCDSQSQVIAGSSRFYLSSTDFVPSHRKSRSLGAGSIVDSGKVSLERLLIDDSVIDTLPETGELVVKDHVATFNRYTAYNNSANGAVTLASASTCIAPPEIICSSPTPSLLEGYVKRKTLLKDGMHPVYSAWIRFWIQLTPCAMLYYPAVSFKGASRDKFHHRPCKTVALTAGWTAKPVGYTDPDCFTLIDPTGKNVYLLKAASGAKAWCHLITFAVQQNRTVQ